MDLDAPARVEHPLTGRSRIPGAGMADYIRSGRFTCYNMRDALVSAAL